MDYVVAQSLISKTRTVEVALNDVSEAVDGIADPQERESYRRVVGELMATCAIKLTMPIVTQHPSLDPDASSAP